MSYRLHQDTALGAVKLKISELDRSIAFYEKVVGLTVTERTAYSATLSVHESEPLVLLEQIPNAVVAPQRRRTAGLYHFALLLPTREALGQTLKRLIAAEIPIGQADHLVSEALYISDPDNNGIELYADRPRSDWRRDANGDYVMASDPIDWDGLLDAAGSDTSPILPSGTIIGHVHFHTVGLAESRAFYTDQLGFDIVGDYAQMRALFVSAGGYHHHIGLNIWAGAGAPAAQPNDTGLAYFTIQYPDAHELAKAIAHLRSKGTAVEESDGTAYTTDPSSIRIKLVSKS
ncbi:VOC family protein [Paenibacillus sp. NEAU-GSW1]|uniref:VOC family protein n=1 Tax=Paenibacillus sp. NEAU-GSW1 TaxID=2682486 RepID=UPI0012E11151|nr:VOC family protein [Paenibacillus sp. NEAU-GSW1]MUT66911.1 glyoxalase [Paenibacillus sp. NEAU-GSW1]